MHKADVSAGGRDGVVLHTLAAVVLPGSTRRVKSTNKAARRYAWPQRLSLLLTGSCCAFNVLADDASTNVTMASLSRGGTYAAEVANTSADTSADASGDGAKPVRRHGYSEIKAQSLPAWDRPAPSPAETLQRHLNPSGVGDMAPTRMEFSHWAYGLGGAGGVALGVVQLGGAGAAMGGPAEVRSGSANGSSLELGLRWRSNMVAQRRIDVAAWRRLNNDTPDAYTQTQTVDNTLYAARVEVQFPSAKYGGLAPEFGAIGMQMNGGGKVVLRAKRGGPMVYYRSAF